MKQLKGEVGLTMFIDAELKRQAKMAALTLNVTMKDFIVEAIREKINKTKKEN